MNTADLVILSVALACAAAAGLQAMRGGETGRTASAFMALLLGAGVGLTLLEVATVWLGQTDDPWNAARLAPVAAFHRGFALYYPLDRGPVLSTVVGPVGLLAYWPASLLTGSPTALVLAGSALNLAAFGWLGARVLRRLPVSRVSLVAAWLVGVQLALLYPSLRYSIFCIHADAPALFLCILGADLLLSEREASWGRCAAAALCVALAVWAKQSLGLAFAAATLLVGLRDGLRPALRLVAASAVVGCLVSAAFAGIFGFTNLRDNMFVVPAHHPWYQISLATGEVYPQLHAVGTGAHVKVIVAEGLHLVRESWVLVALMVVVVADHLRHRRPGEAAWPRAHWAGFLFFAICLVPAAAIGRAKVGGEVNHESIFVLFLVAALVCWLVERGGAAARSDSAAAGVLCVLLLVNAPQLLDYAGWRSAWDNQNEASFNYDRAHPGAIYFPWNPLSALLAEGRLYHFDYGVFDRNLGGAQVSRRHLNEALPRDRPVIASWIAHHDYILHTYFPDYVELRPRPELPGWRIYGPKGTR